MCMCESGRGEVKVCACVGLCWGPAVEDRPLRGKCLDFVRGLFSLWPFLLILSHPASKQHFTHNSWWPPTQRPFTLTLNTKHIHAPLCKQSRSYTPPWAHCKHVGLCDCTASVCRQRSARLIVLIRKYIWSFGLINCLLLTVLFYITKGFFFQSLSIIN